MLIHWIPRAHTWMNSTIRHCIHHDVAQRVRRRIINFRGKPNVRVSVPTCTRLEDNKKCRVRRRANCAHLLFASLDAFALPRIRILARAKTLSHAGKTSILRHLVFWIFITLGRLRANELWMIFNGTECWFYPRGIHDHKSIFYDVRPVIIKKYNGLLFDSIVMKSV